MTSLPTTAMSDEHEYVLGTGDDELARLGLQHRIWAADAARAWELAGFGPGMRLLDVGCGPGHAAFDLAELVGPTGSVHGVDISERFVRRLRAEAGARRVAHVTAELADVERLELPAGAFDGAWCRWVLCFARDPEAVVRAVARALRPGGTFAVQDYSRYDGVYLAPPHPGLERIFQAVVEAWRASGGNPRVGADLPALMERCGLSVEAIEPISRIARPGTQLWAWPRTFLDNFLPGLVEQGRLAAEERDAFEALWAEREAMPGAYFHSPPMIRMVARRR